MSAPASPQTAKLTPQVLTPQQLELLNSLNISYEQLTLPQNYENAILQASLNNSALQQTLANAPAPIRFPGQQQQQQNQRQQQLQQQINLQQFPPVILQPTTIQGRRYYPFLHPETGNLIPMSTPWDPSIYGIQTKPKPQQNQAQHESDDKLSQQDFDTYSSVARVNPPRPPNKYILYRADKHQELKESHPEWDNTRISKETGRNWKAETEEVRCKYAKKAEDLKNIHARLYPGYKYCPRKRKGKGMRGFV